MGKYMSVFNEGKLNNFLVFLMDSNNPSYQDEILEARDWKYGIR